MSFERPSRSKRSNKAGTSISNTILNSCHDSNIWYPHRCGFKYLLSDFNRDGDSYRSPWSNEYHPSLPDGTTPFLPSADLRTLEVYANHAWNVYRKLYYGKEAISSVYLWNKDNGRGGFAGSFLIQKQLENVPVMKVHTLSGYWNSIHVIDVTSLNTTGKVKYKLTTTILLSLKLQAASELSLGGSLTKQLESVGVIKTATDHMGNIGPMLESVETEMRSNMDALYLQKTKDIVMSLRSSGVEREREGLMATLMKETIPSASADLVKDE